MISLPVTAPFLEYLTHSYHTHHQTGFLVLKPAEFIFLFVPYFLGNHDFILAYAGVVAPLLALFAFFSKKKQKLIWFFGGFILFYLAKSFGVYGTNWIGGLPLFRETYFPKYFHSAFILSLAFCSATGIDAIVGSEVPGWRRIVPFAPIPAYLGVFYFAYADSIKQLGLARFVLPQFGAAVLTLAFVGLVLAVLWKHNKRWLGGFLGAFLFIELFYHALPLDYPRRANSFAPAPYVEFLKEDPLLFRVFSIQGILPPNYSAVVGLSDIGFNSGIFVERYIELMRKVINPACGYGKPVNTGAPDVESRFLDLFNVKYLITKTYLRLPASRFPLVYDAEVKIYRNLHCMPRAFVVHQWDVIRDESHVLGRLLSQSFDFRRTAIIEEQPEYPMVSAASDPENVQRKNPTLRHYGSGEIVIEAVLSKPGLLVLTDSFFPGWRASVDGKDARILRADYLFRAVSLPAGAHVVRFEYQPLSFWIPLAISLAVLAGIAAFVVWKAARRSIFSGPWRNFPGRDNIPASLNAGKQSGPRH